MLVNYNFMYDPIFENLLDIKSYDFVQNANKNLNSNIVKLMANELMEHIVNDKIKKIAKFIQSTKVSFPLPIFPDMPIIIFLNVFY